MKKEFNDTGLCVSNKHYMIDTTPQLKETIELIEKGKYFIINRPRQFGKTTTIALLETTPLLDDYIVLSLSFEEISDGTFAKEDLTCKMIIRQIKEELEFNKIEFDKSTFEFPDIFEFKDFSIMVSKFIRELNKPVVLLIDEVDQASNNRLFVKFLGLLRSKYLLMARGKDYSFHSVVLAGLHDVKNLKLKLRPNEEATYNSPWNIAISYDVDMTFKAKQIETMLVDYVSATNAKMDIAFIAEKLYYHTSGYPYFVSKLCKIIDEKIKPKVWKEIDVIESIIILLKEKGNANFDTVIKNLENNEDLFRFIQSISLNGKTYNYYSSAPITDLAIMHGLIGDNNGKTKIMNKIYDEFITDYMIGKRETSESFTEVVQSQFLKDNGKLDLEKLLTKFKDAFEEKYSSATYLKNKEFLEDDLRMQFFMYLKPVLNSVGFCCKEVQTSEERRMDVLIFFKDEKFIIELKIWKGKKLHEDGIKQIKNYMQREHVDKGYMLILNKNKTKEFKTTNEDGIFTAWV